MFSFGVLLRGCGGLFMFNWASDVCGYKGGLSTGFDWLNRCLFRIVIASSEFVASAL